MFVERVFCDYMENYDLSQYSTVTLFGEGCYYRLLRRKEGNNKLDILVLQNGENVIINWILQSVTVERERG